MKTKKHPKANLEKFSMLFMQLGLVLALFVSYLAIEKKTEKDVYNVDQFSSNVFIEDVDQTVEIEVEKPELMAVPQATVLIIEPKIIDNDDDDEFVETVLKADDIDAPVDILKNLVPLEVIDENIIEDVPFISVEEAPIFPGCKGTNEEKKKCFSKKIQQLVNRKFNGGLAQELGLMGGKKRITVLFKIDKNGNVVELRARAPHKSLEKEALRVVQQLPKMIPGKMQGRPVNVSYVLPILFKVE